VAGWEPFLQLGSPGLVLLVLWLIVKSGDLRTKFEVASWESRTVRAETQVDTLLPALTEQTKAIDELADMVRLLKEHNERLLRMVPPPREPAA
jgi:hypothetical protein